MDQSYLYSSHQPGYSGQQGQSPYTQQGFGQGYQTAHQGYVSQAALAYRGHAPHPDEYFAQHQQTAPTAGYASYANPAAGHARQMHASPVPALTEQYPYGPKQTAYANNVSPVALVYQGQVSAEAMNSLYQFHNPFTTQPGYPNRNLASHAAHATENQAALQFHARPYQ
ncbi:hypothetical protein [Brevibacillus massiliensis]|jgi:hypothetical protein|uniref:hypothetical protein n=1 Tax=Brevibacillus massiliensis TaxID=1118054 RepID=UPI00030D1F21|nr:hypothetical protein [Brevibacillus massiliensis]